MESKRVPVFKIWPVGSWEFLIEEGDSIEDACQKAGVQLQDSEVQIIPEEQVIVL